MHIKNLSGNGKEILKCYEEGLHVSQIFATFVLNDQCIVLFIFS